jgi:hypothetical protein
MTRRQMPLSDVYKFNSAQETVQCPLRVDVMGAAVVSRLAVGDRSLLELHHSRTV